MLVAAVLVAALKIAAVIVNVLQIDVVHVNVLKSFVFCIDLLEIYINYLLGKHMFVGRVACFIYWDKGSQLAKSLFESVDGLDTFYFDGNNQIGEAFLSCC